MRWDCEATIFYERQAGGSLLFWALDPPSDLIEWLAGQDLSARLNYQGTRARIASHFVAWIFERSIDAFWCRLRFASQCRSWPEACQWYDFDLCDDFFSDIEDDLWWCGYDERAEEETWERQVGSLKLGSTGGCPMWQEGPRARPLARPRRYGK